MRAKRARLRTPTEADLEDHLTWHADPELTKWMARRPVPQSLAQRKEWLAETAKDRDSMHWEIGTDEEHLGYCSARRGWRWDAWFVYTIFLAPDARGKGYALEAARALHRYLVDHAGMQLGEAWLYRDDVAGRRLCEALGYREYAHGHDVFYREGRWWDDWRAAVQAEDFRRRFPRDVEYPDRERP